MLKPCSVKWCVALVTDVLVNDVKGFDQFGNRVTLLQVGSSVCAVHKRESIRFPAARKVDNPSPKKWWPTPWTR